MPKKQIILLLLSLFAEHVFSQHIYRTQPLSDEIKTVQVVVNNDAFLPPIIQLNGNDIVTLKFDKLSLDEPRLRYQLLHCTADWQKDNLSEIEYQDGFNDQLIENYRFSENTTVNYIHYSLRFPNAQMRPKVSGNYAIEVFYENYPDEPLLQACFSVAEPKVTIQAGVSGDTDIDINNAHQQLSFTVNYPTLSLRDPANELIVNVRQNNRTDNQRSGLKPTFINPAKLVFEHNRDLIFEAGNEYRRFETVSNRFGGMRVERLIYEKPYFHAVLQSDESRAGKSRQYDEDQNGRFFIKDNDAYDSDVEADYFMVHFTFYEDGSQELFLIGDFTYGTRDDFKLQYNKESDTYLKTVLLKQGAYNYMYATPAVSGLTTAKTEGNYYETENEYLITVYHRAPGSRYDKLVGWQKVETKKR